MVTKMTLTKREKIGCGWVEKKPAKPNGFSKAVNLFEHEVTGITLTSPSPSSKEINNHHAQPFENGFGQFRAIELTRHNTYR